MDNREILPEIIEINNNQGIAEKGRIYCGANKISPQITYSFPKKVVGYFFIDIAENTGDELLIEYGPFLNCMFFRFRINLLGKRGLFITEDTHAMKYLRISLIDKSVSPEESYLNFNRIGIIDGSYDYKLIGKFECDDSVLNEIWNVGAYTVKLCTQQQKHSCNYFQNLPKEIQEKRENFKSEFGEYVIFDGARRDKEAWIGDLRTENLIVYSAFNDDAPIKATLDLFLQLQDKRGLVPGSGTSCQPFLTYNLWWIISIWEHYFYTGDLNFLKHMSKGVSKFEDYLKDNIDDNGFLPNSNYDNTWMWTFPRSKIVVSVQAELYFALQCLIKINKQLNLKNKRDWEKVCINLKQNFNKNYYNENKGVYEEQVNLKFEKEPVFLDVNAYAVSFSLCDDLQAERVLDYLKNNNWTEYGTATTDFEIENAQLTDDEDGMMIKLLKDNGIANTIRPHNYKIWPFMVGYEVDANFKQKRTDDAIKIIKSTWGNMLEKGATTFWEMADKNGDFVNYSFIPQAKHDCIDSACHGWSGWVTHLLSKYVLGVRPLEAGFKKILISPQISDLKKVSGIVPTNNGNIRINIMQGEDLIKIKVECRRDIEIVTDFSHLSKKVLFEEIRI